MKLAYSPTSPYVRKVMVLLHETNQLADVTLEEQSGTPLAPAAGLLPQNPLGKVPALARADGPAILMTAPKRGSMKTVPAVGIF
jgi:glutathione S-transferase